MKRSGKLTKNDLSTFLRLVGFARPYWGRLLLGALCSAVGGGSIVALILSAQQILGFIFDTRAILQGEEVPSPKSQVQSPESQVQRPEFQVQRPESPIQRPESVGADLRAT